MKKTKQKKTIPAWLSMWLIDTHTQTWAYTAWEHLTSDHRCNHFHPLFSAIRVINRGHHLRKLCKINMLLSFSYLQIWKLLWLEHLGNFPKNPSAWPVNTFGLNFRAVWKNISLYFILSSQKFNEQNWFLNMNGFQCQPMWLIQPYKLNPHCVGTSEVRSPRQST